MKRRHFISLSIGSIAAAASNSAIASDDPISAEITASTRHEQLDINPVRILPISLSKGDTIGITAPASPTNAWEIRHSVNKLKSMGFKIDIGETIKNRKEKYKYLSAPDDVRAAEFMEFVKRDDIKAILCGRGGYGITRILPMLDFDEIKSNPKIIIGFSDITALLNAIYLKTGLVCFHGPVAASTFSNYTTDYLEKVIIKSKFKPIVCSSSNTITINPGIATGKLIGGNLSMLSGTLGTEYEIDTNGAIIFIEEVDEHPYKIDKMLTQLWLAGKFEDCCGIVVGYFKGLNSRRSFYPGGSYTIKEVLVERIRKFNVPAFQGLQIGHVKDRFTLPIGIKAELDADNKSLTILEPSVI